MCFSQNAFAFDPVPIDEFFKRYPDEKGDVEEFLKSQKKR